MTISKFNKEIHQSLEEKVMETLKKINNSEIYKKTIDITCQKTSKKNTSINCNESTEGETIEKKVEKIFENKEPITDGSPLIYTERKDGVENAYNIRADKWDIAQEALTSRDKNQLAKRQEAIKELNQKPTGEGPE